MDVGEKKPKRKGPSCPVGIVKEKNCEGNGVDDKVDFPKMCFFSQAKKYINLKTLTTSPIVLGRPRYVASVWRPFFFPFGQVQYQEALYSSGSNEGMKEEKENDISPVINEGSIEK